MTAYKLFRKKKDGNLGPLFIDRKLNIPHGVPLEAKFTPRKGFAPRKGWHCTLKPVAPHLKTTLKNGEQRVWCQVEVEEIEHYSRPESQGGSWVLAQRMTLITEL